MGRRSTLSALLLLAAALTAIAPCGTNAQAAANATTRPNVLFIAVDDLNDFVLDGYRGPTKFPAFERIKRMGMTFMNAHAPAPVCSPSRAAIMSGLYPTTNLILQNVDGHFRDSPVLKNFVMLPQHFLNHGYTTEGSGKGK
jgi:iduronate 2-sulfatase